MLRFLCGAACAAFLTASLLAEETIKIGEYASLTGKEAAYGQTSHKGILMAVEEINAHGGVLGKKIELVTEDDQSKQGESATAVKKLISRDKVVAVLGEVASIRSLEAAPVCQTNRIPMVSSASVNSQVTAKGDYIFRVCFVDSFQGGVLATFALNTLKAHRVAVLTSVSNAYSVGMTKIFKEHFIAGDGTIVADQKYNEGDKDFRAQLTAIKAANPDAIIATGYYTEAALICVQARQLGLNIPIFGGDGWDAPALLEIGGKAMEGTYFSTHYSPDNPSPAVQEFNQHYRARWGEQPDAWAALGYDSAQVLADAIQHAGVVSPSKIRDALAGTTDFPAVTGKITIDENRNASKSAVILTVKDGKYQFVTAVAP
ncbi:MAG TPA: ABC transporter substrate-binding protein [Candidatus Didemnitutus sp.]|nr:ABC transporter substrate-binding protein [Candidatus Didemnitutus sp.]